MLTPVELKRNILIDLCPGRWKESLMRREAEQARQKAHLSALRLTEHLLTYPRVKNLQKAPSLSLPDGRIVNTSVIATLPFNSVESLVYANIDSDRIEVRIRNEKGDQYGYAIDWRISQLLQRNEYHEYQKGQQISGFSEENCEVLFDFDRQRRVYTRCKEIFDTALASLTAQQFSTRLP